MVDHGFFRSGREGRFGPIATVKAFNEILLGGGVAAIELIGRIYGALGGMTVAAAVQIAREAGASESEARRLERDLNMIAEITGLFLPYQIATSPGALVTGRVAAQRIKRRAGDFAEVAARTGRSVSPALFQRWARDVIETKRPAGQSAKVGEIGNLLKQKLANRNYPLEASEIVVQDHDLAHMMRDAKVAGLPESYILDLPNTLRNAKTVLLDLRNGNLLFVFDVPGDPRKGKFVIQLNVAVKQRTPSGTQYVTANRVRSGGLVDEANLRDRAFYEPLAGAL